MSAKIRLSSITVNAPDAIELAKFYAEIIGGVAKGSSHWAAAVGADSFIAFQRDENFRPPEWPTGTAPAQLHLDFYVEDLAASEARVLSAGATRFDNQPNSDHCFVYADPAGHPFCLSTWDGPQMAQDLSEQ